MGSGGGIKEIRDQGQTGAKLATLCIVLGATNEPAVTEAKQKKRNANPEEDVDYRWQTSPMQLNE